jgi:Fe2+ transport system protein FeoA
MQSLNNINSGQRATIVAIEGTDAVVHYLKDIGMLIGSQIEMLYKSSPSMVKFGNTKLALSNSVLERILVQTL